MDQLYLIQKNLGVCRLYTRVTLHEHKMLLQICMHIQMCVCACVCVRVCVCVCDLLYFSGPLIPRHVEVFRDNSFFKGISLPTPDKMVQQALHYILPMLYDVICFNTGTIRSEVWWLPNEGYQFHEGQA